VCHIRRSTSTDHVNKDTWWNQMMTSVKVLYAFQVCVSHESMWRVETTWLVPCQQVMSITTSLWQYVLWEFRHQKMPRVLKFWILEVNENCSLTCRLIHGRWFVRNLWKTQDHLTNRRTNTDHPIRFEERYSKRLKYCKGWKFQTMKLRNNDSHPSHHVIKTWPLILKSIKQYLGLALRHRPQSQEFGHMKNKWELQSRHLSSPSTGKCTREWSNNFIEIYWELRMEWKCGNEITNLIHECDWLLNVDQHIYDEELTLSWYYMKTNKWSKKWRLSPQ
jgi:hypothetical protein